MFDKRLKYTLKLLQLKVCYSKCELRVPDAITAPSGVIDRLTVDNHVLFFIFDVAFVVPFLKKLLSVENIGD